MRTIKDLTKEEKIHILKKILIDASNSTKENRRFFICNILQQKLDSIRPRVFTNFYTLRKEFKMNFWIVQLFFFGKIFTLHRNYSLYTWWSFNYHGRTSNLLRILYLQYMVLNLEGIKWYKKPFVLLTYRKMCKNVIIKTKQ